MILNLPTQAGAQALASAQTPAEIDPVLRQIASSFGALRRAGTAGEKLYMAELDAAVCDLPKRLGLADVRHDAKSNDNVVVIGTEFYNVGGHTRVAADIMRLVGRDRSTLILTNIYNRPWHYSAGLKAHVSEVDLSCRSYLMLKSASLLDRVFELYNMLMAIRPTRIFLLNHHLDACAIAGTYPFRDIVEFVHHADFEPCLGATVAFSAHVDPTLKAHRCCQAAGLNPIYSSMTVPGLLDQTFSTADVSEPLVLGTAGHPTKYLASGGAPWTDWIVAALRDSDRRFIHIGPRSEALDQAVSAALEAAGIETTRYAMVGSAPSVREALLAHGVQVYVGSSPQGGGLSALEALSAAIPTLMPADPARPSLLGLLVPIPGWREISNPEELAAALTRVSILHDELRAPSFPGLLKDEFSRFERYVRGERLPEMVVPDAAPRFQPG